jgi:hypothetical protein
LTIAAACCSAVLLFCCDPQVILVMRYLGSVWSQLMTAVDMLQQAAFDTMYHLLLMACGVISAFMARTAQLAADIRVSAAPSLPIV